MEPRPLRLSKESDWQVLDLVRTPSRPPLALPANSARWRQVEDPEGPIARLSGMIDRKFAEEETAGQQASG